MYKLLVGFLLNFAACVIATDVTITSLQVFSIPILPQYFNWTSNEGRNEYRYEASLLGAPDMPSWIHYTYSKRTHRGYLYGVAPKDQKNFKLEIIALNKKTYETRDTVIEVLISKNDYVSKYQIQLKVNNWNVEDMFDENRTESLFEIVRDNIWKNATDLQLTFLAPASELGARYPLKPGEGVGTVLRIGSSTPFSADLQSVEKEIEPATRIWSTCSFKKVSFDRLFRDYVFDWCYFKLIEESFGPQQQESSASVVIPVAGSSSNIREHRPEFRWSQSRRVELPRRGYRRELVASVLVPAFLLLVLVTFLSAALCLHHDDLITMNGKRGTPLLMDNGMSNGVQNVQMIQYAGANIRDRSSTLRSLHSATAKAAATCSPTPSDSFSSNRSPRFGTDHSNSHVRPNPPPYSPKISGPPAAEDYLV